MTQTQCSVVHPNVAILKNVSIDEWESTYKPRLQYIDYNTQQVYDRHVRNLQWKRTDHVAWQKQLEQLQKRLTVPLYAIKVQREADVDVVCRPASLHVLPNIHVTNEIVYPSLNNQTYQWRHPFPFTLHQYQQDAVARLLQTKHCHVELTTGSGKTAIILELVRQCGLRCAVIVPGKENFKSLYGEFIHYFGADVVGLYGDGKKCLHRPITLCVGKSLAMIDKQKSSDAWLFFSQLDALVVDESHTWGSQSMSQLCSGLFANVPCRFFMSATQVRSDEEDPLLFSIIGPCVYTLTTAEAVRAQYINNHTFEIYANVPATRTLEQADLLSAAMRDTPMTVRRIAYLYNDAIADIIVQRTLHDLELNRASIVLVDEVGQIALLVNVFKQTRPDIGSFLALAHGETNTARLRELDLPNNTAKSMEKAVLDMNRGQKLILIATGCVQTGASFYTPHTCYNFVGGGAKNRIRTLQGAVGRAVRKWTSNPYLSDVPSHVVPKKDAVIVDFDVDQPQMQKHLTNRLAYYALSGTSIQYINN